MNITSSSGQTYTRICDYGFIKKDHEITDTQLYMTKKNAKLQHKQKGNKNVGAGTAESRAGEAMVHKGLRELLSGESLDTVIEVFTDMVNDPTHILHSKEGKTWVKSCRGILNKLIELYPIDTIDQVVWDTNFGKMALGIEPKLVSSSDMYIRLKDGRNIGISLKKTGNVFISNFGWSTTAVKILKSIEKLVTPSVYNKLETAMSIDTYNNDLIQRYRDTLNTISDEDISESLERLLKEPQSVQNKLFGGVSGPRYLNVLRNPTELRNTILTSSKIPGIEKKAYSKILQMYHPNEYQYLRDVDNSLTERTFLAINSSPDAIEGMNIYILQSMHVIETLGLCDDLVRDGVDEFITLYGIHPNGAVLNEQSLNTLFGQQFIDAVLDVRLGRKTHSELFKLMSDLMKLIYDSGLILFKHPSMKFYPLFKMMGRSRTIGVAPVMEIIQTTFMAHALREGTFNMEYWNPKTIKSCTKYLVDVT